MSHKINHSQGYEHCTSDKSITASVSLCESGVGDLNTVQLLPITRERERVLMNENGPEQDSTFFEGVLDCL